MLPAAARHAARRCTNAATTTALLMRSSAPAASTHRPPSILLAAHHPPGAFAAARRRRCCSTAAAAASNDQNNNNNEKKHRVLFLGTPDVAADVLNELLRASAQPGATFQVVGVVTQPGKPRGRGNRAVPLPSPVEEAAAAAARAYEAAGGAASGLPPPPVVLTPPNARDPAFYEALQALGGGGEGAADGDVAAATAAASDAAPADASTPNHHHHPQHPIDLAVTAAYGHILPQRFLDLPRLGTLNIHPSRLPLHRGAAPVPRAVEAGERRATVSLAYTVLRCDAGPVLATREVDIGPDEPAPELLARLFAEGARLLLESLPGVWSSEAARRAQPQDEARATHAPKMSKEEGELAWGARGAQGLHDKVRAFAGWPGTSGAFAVVGGGGDEEGGAGGNGNGNGGCNGGGDGNGGGANRLQLKIVRTSVPPAEDCARADREVSSGVGAPPSCREVAFLDGGKRMLVPCGWEEQEGGGEGGERGIGGGGGGGGAAPSSPCSSPSWLEVLELQPPGKKAMAPRDFKNGLGKGKRLVVEAGTGYRGPPGGGAADSRQPQQQQKKAPAA